MLQGLIEYAASSDFEAWVREAVAAEDAGREEAPEVKTDLGRVLAAMRDVAEVARSDPGAVRSALAAVVESITFRPGADG